MAKIGPKFSEIDAFGDGIASIAATGHVSRETPDSAPGIVRRRHQRRETGNHHEHGD